MKRAKTKRTIPPLAANASDEEIVKWLTKYDLDERLAAGVTEIGEIHEPSKQENQTTRLTLRVSPSMKSTLEKIARQHTTRASTLARAWLTERLRQELNPRKRPNPRRAKMRAS
jgi:hypothetical protein